MEQFTSQELLTRTKNIVSDERRATLALIEHLGEINRRLLYAELGYSSLWAFVTKELGISEGAAQRRILAMRLIKDVPNAREGLASGKLSLSNAAKIQSFRQAEKRKGRKRNAEELVSEMENLSQNECEMKLQDLSPEALPPESIRIVSGKGHRELKLVITPELFEQLEELKGLLAHSFGESSYAELIAYATKVAIGRIKKQKGFGTDERTPSTAAAEVKVPPAGERGYLPTGLRRAVWSRANGRCEVYNCGSRYRLEIDHVIPLAMGGSNGISNLRLACWHHNQQQAREKLKMSA